VDFDTSTTLMDVSAIFEKMVSEYIIRKYVEKSDYVFKSPRW